MEPNPSREANSPSASEDIPHILYNLKVHYPLHKTSPLTSNPVSFIRAFIHSFFLSLEIPSQYPPIYLKVSFLHVFPPKPCACISFHL